MTDAQAAASCCDALYAANATCSAVVTCPAGWSPKPGFASVLVNGLVVGGLDSVDRCCDKVSAHAQWAVSD
jgi:hypothetical protein